MEKLSPRSYVTGGFDIIRPALIDFIGKTLRKDNKAWWNVNIYIKLIDEFQKYEMKLSKTGKVSDLYKYFDESMCFKAINKNRKIFKEIIGNYGLELNKELLEIRNQWAHDPGNGMTENDADNAFNTMINYMDIIERSVILRLYSIKDQMHKYYFKDRKVVASKESLISFLKKRVLLPIIKDKRELDKVKEAQDRVKRTQEYMDKMKTANEVVNFFWNNIVNNPRGLESYKILKECGFTTFEDVREEFTTLSYGDNILE